MGRYDNKSAAPPRKTPPESKPDAPTLREGRVVSGYGNKLIVEDPRGNLFSCSARRKLHRIVCGDHVHWNATSPGQGVIESIETRTTLIERHDSNGQGKPLAANVDRIIVTSAFVPQMSEALIDRYLVASELTGADAVLLINKSDLMDEQHRLALEKQLQEYGDIGYPVIFCSTTTAHGTDQLMEHIQSGTSILVGQSGVGKSSIISMLLPNQNIRVGQLSTATGLGRHTTSSTTLYHLSRNSDLIDSPGVRDFQLWHIAPDRVADGFREFQNYLGKCRFHNCRHMKEPGCAVQSAASNGEISDRRLDSYRTIVNSLQSNR